MVATRCFSQAKISVSRDFLHLANWISARNNSTVARAWKLEDEKVPYNDPGDRKLEKDGYPDLGEKRGFSFAGDRQDTSRAWNVMLSDYGRRGKVREAKNTFDKMEARTIVSWNALLTAYARHGRSDLESTRAVFSRMPQQNSISWTVMIAACGVRREPEEAGALLQTIPEPTFDTWGATIAAFAQNDRKDEALDLLKVMDLEGLVPSQRTLAIVVSACARAGALGDGKLLHRSLWLTGQDELEVVLANALVHMYGRCGCLELASLVFAKLQSPNTISWSALVAAYARGGRGESALELFWKMRLEGNELDSIAFTNILSACSHGGLVRHGWNFYNLMVEDHALVPTLEHYSCLADLHGRVGEVDVAEELLRSMPIKPDAVSWRSLLGACRNHKEVKIGSRAQGRASSLDGGDPSSYELLSSIYRTG